MAHFDYYVVTGIGGGKERGPESLIDEGACAAPIAGEVGNRDREVVRDVVAPAGDC